MLQERDFLGLGEEIEATGRLGEPALWRDRRSAPTRRRASPASSTATRSRWS